MSAFGRPRLKQKNLSLANCGGQLMHYWLGRGKTPLPADIDAAQFHRFFDDKVAGVRSTTSDAPPPFFHRILPLRRSVSSSR